MCQKHDSENLIEKWLKWSLLIKKLNVQAASIPTLTVDEIPFHVICQSTRLIMWNGKEWARNKKLENVNFFQFSGQNIHLHGRQNYVEPYRFWRYTWFGIVYIVRYFVLKPDKNGFFQFFYFFFNVSTPFSNTLMLFRKLNS